MSGRILGEGFTLGTATYLIDRRPGYERIDIQLSAGTETRPCGPLNPREAPSVWLRRWGATRVEPEQVRIQPGTPGPWEAHYQIRDRHGWRGSDVASALVVIGRRTPDSRLEGELSVCFADGATSCVKGTFVARYCPISVDAPIRGTYVMERPRPEASAHVAEGGPVQGPASVAGPAETPPAPPASAAAAPPPRDDMTIESRSQLIPTYPCSQCHQDIETNTQRRKLVAFHVPRNTELDHGDPSLWCYQCHSSRNIDRLVIANGTLVTFDQADRLCGSCHGDKGRDWRAGIHGITRGYWRGPKVKKLCTHCHNPHNPWFASLTPEARPALPRGGPTPDAHQPTLAEAPHGR